MERIIDRNALVHAVLIPQGLTEQAPTCAAHQPLILAAGLRHVSTRILMRQQDVNTALTATSAIIAELQADFW